MAKLYKNAHISTEEIYLNQVEPALAPMEDPPLETPVIDDSQAEHIRQEAYEQGYLAGKTAKRVQLEQEQDELKKQLEQVLASIPDAVAQNRMELTKEIADIVFILVKQFFIENQHNHQALSQQINHILLQLNNQHTVELCLHPQEIAALQNGAIHLNTAHLNGLKIKGDESLTLGGYLIKTNHGVFDASIEKQIDKLKEVLLQLKHRGTHVPMD